MFFLIMIELEEPEILIFQFPHTIQKVELKTIADPQDLSFRRRGQIRHNQFDRFKLLVCLTDQ
jgi:hypothetical protein